MQLSQQKMNKVNYEILKNKILVKNKNFGKKIKISVQNVSKVLPKNEI